MKRRYIPIEELLPYSEGSRYKLTMLAAKRALQLSDGAKGLAEKIGEKALDNAMQEIFVGKVRVKATKE